MPHCRIHFRPDTGSPKDAKNEAFLAAIRARKSGTDNFHRPVVDFRKILEESRPARRQSGGPSSWPLIAANDAPFSEPLPPEYRVA